MAQIDDEFGDWMETISVESFLGDGAWEEGFAAPVAIKSHWQYENRVVITSDGKTVTSSTQLQCSPEHRALLNDGARVTLPGDFRKYRVVSMRTWPGDDTHLEVGLV